MIQGLFSKKVADHNPLCELSELHQGCSQTYYPEMMDESIGYGISLFDMLQGFCWYFAKFFQHKHPEWDVMSAIDNEGNVVHAFLKKVENGTILFADARGITDDPDEFFSEFDMTNVSYIEKDTDEMPLSWFNASYENAYQLVFGTL